MRVQAALAALVAVTVPASNADAPVAPSRRVAGTGDAVTPPLSFGNLQSLQGLADDGTALFIDATDPGRDYPFSAPNLSTRSGGLRAPVVLGDAAPGGSHFAQLYNQLYSTVYEDRLSRDGHTLLFFSAIADTREGMFLYDLKQPDHTLAAITPLVMTGEPAPQHPVPPNAGAPTWLGFSSYGGPSGAMGAAVNNRGDVVFSGIVGFGPCTPQRCDFRNGLFFKPAGAPVQVIAWEGFVAGGTLSNYSSLQLNEDGVVALAAIDSTRHVSSDLNPDCSGTTPACNAGCGSTFLLNGPCVYRWKAGTLETLACEGDPFPDGSGAIIAFSGADFTTHKYSRGIHRCFPDDPSDCKTLLSLTDSGEVVLPLYAQGQRTCDGATIPEGVVTYTIPASGAPIVETRPKAGVFGFRADRSVHTYASVGAPTQDLSTAATSNCPCVIRTVERGVAAPDGAVAFAAEWEGGMQTGVREIGFGLFVDTGAGFASLLTAAERAAYTSPGALATGERVLPPYHWGEAQPFLVGGGGFVAFPAFNANNYGLFAKAPGGAVQRISQSNQPLPGGGCMPLSSGGNCLPTTHTYFGGTPTNQQGGQAESFFVNASGEAAALVNRTDKSRGAFGQEYRGLYVLRDGSLQREATYGEPITVGGAPRRQLITPTQSAYSLWATEAGEIAATVALSGGNLAVGRAGPNGAPFDALAVTGQPVFNSDCFSEGPARLSVIYETRISQGPGGEGRVLFTGEYQCDDNSSTRSGLFEATGGQLKLLESACTGQGFCTRPWKGDLRLTGIADLPALPAGVTDPAGHTPAFLETEGCPPTGSCIPDNYVPVVLYRDACGNLTNVAAYGSPAPGGGTFAGGRWSFVDHTGTALLFTRVDGVSTFFRTQLQPDLAACGPPTITFERLITTGDVIGGARVNFSELAWGTNPADFFVYGNANYATTGFSGTPEIVNGVVKDISAGATRLPGFGAPPGVRVIASSHMVQEANSSGEALVQVDLQRPGPIPGCRAIDGCESSGALYVRSTRRDTPPPVRAPSEPNHWCAVAGAGLPVQDGSVQRIYDRNQTYNTHLDEQGRVAFHTSTTQDQQALLLWTRLGSPPWPVAYPDLVTQVSCNPSGTHFTFGAQTSDPDGDPIDADWVLPPEVQDANPGVDLTRTSVDLVVPPGSWTIGTRVYDNACMAYDEVKVTVVDDTPPVFNAPAQVTQQCGAALQPPAVTDCSAVRLSEDGPEVVPLGVVNVTWTATDPGERSATLHQQITGVDTTAPQVYPPEDTSVVYGDTPVLGTADVYEQCDPAPVLTNDLPAALPCGQTVTVSWCARDAAGNQGCAPQLLEVLAPEGGCPADGGVDAGSLDAGSPDAGSLDAGSLDAGSLDAGSFDAGSPDAGATDAGPADAGSLDAGPADAGQDAGATADGGSDAGPGGSDAGDDAGSGVVPPAKKSDSGCGCDSTTPSGLAIPALLLALAWPKRRRRRAWRG